jgi:MFS family permease
MAGGIVIWLFFRWQDLRVRRGLDPLVRKELFSIAPLRSGIACFFNQNLILLGIFFILPLYLQIVLGLDALDTGIRMLPISIAMFLTSSSGPLLAERFGPKRVVQAGFVMLVIAAFWMLGSIEPELDGAKFALSLAALGIGMGLVASQLGSVIQSSVGAQERGEAGGLQYTAQQLGSATGTALIGAIVLSSLVAAFVDDVGSRDDVSDQLSNAIEVEVAAGASFVAADLVADGLADAGVDPAEADAVVEEYSDAQLDSLKIGLLISGFLALVSLGFTRPLPGKNQHSDQPTNEAQPA